VIQVSATQIKTFKCPRKWAFQKIARVPRIESPALALGIRLHEYAEAWLRDGTPPDNTDPMGRLFNSGIPYLPTPGTVRVEGEDIVPLTDGVELYIRLDWDAPGKFGDHKTCADWKWALNAKSLARDIQANAYAYALMHRRPKLERIRAIWTYYNKRSGVARNVEIEFKRADVEAFVKREIVPSAIAIRELRTFLQPGDDLNDIPNDPGQCDWTGRFCDAAEHCRIDNRGVIPIEKLRKNMSDRKTLEELKAEIERKRLGQVNPPEAEKTAAATAAEILEPEKAVAEVTEKKTRGRPKKAAAPAPSTPTEITVGPGQRIEITIRVVPDAA